ncbi:MAG: NUDIX hydrolase [Paludibacteraceae bacterium]
MKQEIFPIVDEDGKVMGSATRKKCHSGSFLLHPVVHLHVCNSQGDLFLQKRANNKDVQPGKWDTSVGGHIDYGETIENALMREAREELGLLAFEPVFMFRYVFQSNVERELVNSFHTVYNGHISSNKFEISEGKFWTLNDIKNNIGKNIFTPNFEDEFDRLRKHLSLQ